MLKKVFLVLICLMLLAPSILYAAKDTSYTCVCNENIELTFNVPKHSGGAVLYIPIYAVMKGQAVTEDGGKRDVVVSSEIGTPAASKATSRAIYALLDADYLQTLYAAFINEAVSVDVSGE